MAQTDIRVLLVDDEEDFLKLLAKRLRRRQLEVRCASTAEDALDVLSDQRIDVVVFDIRLPGMDGLGLMGNLRQRGLEVPVVILTGHGDEFTARDCLDVYLKDTIGKEVKLLVGTKADGSDVRRLTRGGNCFTPDWSK